MDIHIFKIHVRYAAGLTTGKTSVKDVHMYMHTLSALKPKVSDKFDIEFNFICIIGSKI